MAYALAADAAGNIYIADPDNRRVRKVGSNGIITTVAGTGANGYAHDGRPAAQEALGFPSGVAVDAYGRLYIADYSNKVVYRVTSGLIAVFAGDYLPAFGGDGGPATSAHLYLPNRVALDPFGSVLILDQGNSRVRRVDTNGFIKTIAGNGGVGSTGDGGPGVQASVFPLRAVAADALGDVYLGSSVNSPEPWSYDNRVRIVDSGGTIDTVVGIDDNGDGPSALDTVVDPHGLAAGRQTRLADLYIADSRNNQVRRVDGATGAISTIAGTGDAGFSGDGGPATAARLSAPSDVALDASGNIYVADQNNNRVRRIGINGIITTVAGNGGFGYTGDAVLATITRLASPTGIDVDKAGNIYIADRYNYRVRMVTSQGIISTVAGNGTFDPMASPGDGRPATQVQVGVPTDVVVNPDGSCYIVEFATHRVRKLQSNGVIVPVAGNGNYGAGGDGGLALNAQLNAPLALARDAAGNLYVGDSNNLRVRRIDAVSGVITTVAGDGRAGVEGDGGVATAAHLYPPSGVAVDASGFLYIAQADSSRVRRVLLDTAPATPTGTFTPSPVAAASRTPTPTSVRSATPTASFTATPMGAATNAPTRTPTTTPPVSGTITVTPTFSITLSGAVRYQGSRFEVSDATVELSADGQSRDGGQAVMQAQTDTAGEFALHGVSAGAWRLQLQKVGGVADAVGAVDAVYALQAAGGLRGLPDDAQLACDVNGDGSVSSGDAQLMLQNAVGLLARFPAAQVCDSDWLFTPEPRNLQEQDVIPPSMRGGSCEPGAIVYRALDSDASGQDFSARAFGDCSGDWQPPASSERAIYGIAAPSPPDLRYFRRLRGRVRVSVFVRRPGTFHALDVQLAYDTNILNTPRVTPARGVRAALMVANDQAPGLLAIALAGAKPMRGGRVLTIELLLNSPTSRPPKTSVSMLAGRVAQVH
jgi:sugar lactone lactonase YvrE